MGRIGWALSRPREPSLTYSRSTLRGANSRVILFRMFYEKF